MSESPPISSLTAEELRGRLLEHGVDIPTSVNKGFMVRKLESVLKEKKKTPAPAARGQAAPSSPPSATRSSRSRSRGRSSVAAQESRRTPQQEAVVSKLAGRKSMPASVSVPVPVPSRTTRPVRGGAAANRSYVSAGNRTFDVPPAGSKRPAPGFIREESDEDEEDEEEQERMEEDVVPAPQSQRSLRNGQGLRRNPNPPASAAVSNKRPTPSPQDFKKQRVAEPRSTPPQFSWVNPNFKGPGPSSSRSSATTVRQPQQQQTTFFGSGSVPATNRGPGSSRSESVRQQTSVASDEVETMRSKFSVVVHGRRIQTECIPNTRINPKKFIFNIPEADPVQHIVVLLNDGEELEKGTAAQVFFGWPDEHSNIKWQELGFISNITPSRVFDVSDMKQAVASRPSSSTSQSFLGRVFSPSKPAETLLSGPTTAQIGISLEDL